MNKKTGIAADNYKLEKFKKELKKAGFSDFEIKPFTKDISTIFVNVDESKILDIKNICLGVELHFKRSN